MKLLHFHLKPRSPVVTPYRGDTMLGHILWMFAYEHGENALKELLNKVKDNPPVVSDLFPKDKLPVPLLSPDKDLIDTLKEYRDKKELKKIKYLDFDEWLDLRNDLNAKSLFYALESVLSEKRRKEKRDQDGCLVETQKNIGSEAILHATINRLTGTTTGGAASLHSQDATFYAENTELHGYLAPGIFGEEAEKLLKMVGEHGYGADASTGMGRFGISSCEEIDWQIPPEANAFMALNRFLADDNLRVKDSSYALYTHYGRLGGSFANYGNPFKKPILLFETGSIFKAGPGLYNGKCPGAVMPNVACGHSEPIVHLGFTFPYFINWKEDKNEQV